jgi:tRNA G10  N-methylase Trm11
LTAHPAKFSDMILAHIERILPKSDYRPLVIDPFAGTGKVHQLSGVRCIGVELEPEWAEMHPNTIVANAVQLPFRSRVFEGLVTSPCYGNRLADSHDARDGSVRHSYTHTLGRKLHPDNSGQLQWGNAYRAFHEDAWTEALRVLQDDAFLIINISNHIRGGEEQHVTEWHLNWFVTHGCTVVDIDHVPTKRLREGANHKSRVPYENVLYLRYHVPALEVPA